MEFSYTRLGILFSNVILVGGVRRTLGIGEEDLSCVSDCERAIDLL